MTLYNIFSHIIDIHNKTNSEFFIIKYQTSLIHLYIERVKKKKKKKKKKKINK